MRTENRSCGQCRRAAQARPYPARESGGVRTAGRNQTTENAVVVQQRVELAGHEGRERLDAGAADAHPFAVRPWQNDEAGRRGSPVVERAQDLRLLTAHDVGNPVQIVADEAGHDGKPPAEVPE